MSFFKKILKSINISVKKETHMTPTSKIEPSFIQETGTFSQRIGAKKIDRESQTSYMDDHLRNGLWNVVVQHFFPNLIEPYSIPVRENKEFFSLIEKLWFNFFKFPADHILYDYIGNAMNELRTAYMELKWSEVYDFIEFLIQNNDLITSKPESDFIQLCNNVLERESSYFRIVDRRIAPKKV
jgi:AbiJ N-terminal domain 4